MVCKSNIQNGESARRTVNPRFSPKKRVNPRNEVLGICHHRHRLVELTKLHYYSNVAKIIRTLTYYP
jgi:hypothetical protein